MGTWVCHLRLAENLLPALPGIDTIAFSFGNLAPDSGIPNEDWTVFDPPKEVTHFLRHGEGEGRIRDVQFYNTYVRPLLPDDGSAEWSFRRGYFCHLLCDNLWSHRIVSTTKKEHAAQLSERPKALWDAIKGDWYDLDHKYVRDHPESLFWKVIVPAPNPPMYVPIVPTPALEQQLDFIRTFYSNPEPARNLDRPYPYLSEQTMDRFIAESTKDICSILKQLQHGAQPEGSDTALALLDPARLRPYPSPLGEVVE